jgi:hypothetical protein
MLGDFQKYEVTTKFTFEAEVFPEDPDDVYQLAKLEAKSVAEQLGIVFPELEIKELAVVPVIGE